MTTPTEKYLGCDVHAAGSTVAITSSVVAGGAWYRAADKVEWKVSVPVNATAKVYLPTFATAATAVSVTEGETEIFKNGAATGGAPGVTFDRVDGESPHAFVVLAVARARTSSLGTPNDAPKPNLHAGNEFSYGKVGVRS